MISKHHFGSFLIHKTVDVTFNLYHLFSNFDRNMSIKILSLSL